MRIALFAAALCAVAPMTALAGPIDSACLKSDRSTSPIICDCIQRVANMTLTSSDQQLAAKLLRDPEKVQDIAYSNRASLREFWARYTNFGTAAEQVCAN